MKKVFALLLALVMLFSMTACGLKKDMEIVAAIEMLEEQWTEFYERADTGYGYFEIKNTRKIKIKDTFSVDEKHVDVANEMFSDVDYILEFVLYADYYSSSYPFQPHIYDEIVVYEDGRMEISAHLLKEYGNRIYNYDYSGIVESIEDYGSRYNCKKSLTE